MACANKKLLTINDYEEAGLKKLSKLAGDYYKSGANDEVTLRENRKAFSNYKIRPMFFRRDVSKRNTETTFLGIPIMSPIAVAPTAMQRMAHPEGELATARACEATETIMIMSTISTSSIEEVAQAAPNLTKWFQLYIYKDRSVTKSLVKRAEAAGFKAFVVTVDTPYFGTRVADSRNNFNLPPHLNLANFSADKAQMPSKSSTSGLNEYANSLFDAALTWRDIQWLTSITSLPIVAKGILTEEDAAEAVKHGAKGIIVSNHGARQLDHVPATIEVLKGIVESVLQVDNRVEVYVDGGFRTGTDVLKAIALGAKGVFVGRPVIYGLSVGGENGVKNVIEILRKEFDQAMGLSGCSSLQDLRDTTNLVVKKEWFSSKL